MNKKFPFQVTDSLVEKLNKGQTFIYDTPNGEYVLGLVKNSQSNSSELHYIKLEEWKKLSSNKPIHENNPITKDALSNKLAELYANEIAGNHVASASLNRGSSLNYNINDKTYKISINASKEVNLSVSTNQPNEKTVIKPGTNHNLSPEEIKTQLKEALKKELISPQGSDKSMLQENTKELVNTQAEIKGLEYTKASKKEINAAKQREYELKQSIKTNAKMLEAQGKMTKSAYKDIKKANKTSIIEDVKAIKHKLFQKKDQNEFKKNDGADKGTANKRLTKGTTTNNPFISGSML